MKKALSLMERNKQIKLLIFKFQFFLNLSELTRILIHKTFN